MTVSDEELAAWIAEESARVQPNERLLAALHELQASRAAWLAVGPSLRKGLRLTCESVLIAAAAGYERALRITPSEN